VAVLALAALRPVVFLGMLRVLLTGIAWLASGWIVF
jgi:hypothetical protein